MVNTPNAGHQHPGHPGLVHHQPHPQPYSLPNNQSAYGVGTSQYSTAQGGYSASVAPQYTVQGGQPAYSSGPSYASPPQAQHSSYMLPHHHYDASSMPVLGGGGATGSGWWQGIAYVRSGAQCGAGGGGRTMGEANRLAHQRELLGGAGWAVPGAAVTPEARGA